jgi:dipeptidyl-peptidase-4
MKTFLSVLFLTLLCVMPLSAQIQPVPLTWKQIFDESLTPKGIGPLRWLNDGWYSELRTLDDGRKTLVSVNITDGTEKTIISPDAMAVNGKNLTPEDYQFSADGSRILLQDETEPLWRRSTKATYFVFDVSSQKTGLLLSSGAKISHAEFAPAGPNLVFFRDNNLFLLNSLTSEEKAVTTDGKLNEVINGAADWVYEEEMGFAKAWFWSPDGKFVAFYRFDESRVKTFHMTHWQNPYPKETRFKYPKAGEENAAVTIGVYELETGKTVWMDIGPEKDQYIVRINWTETPGKLAIRRMNRLQNKQDLLLADAKTGQSHVLKMEVSTTWIEKNDDLYFLKNGKQFVYVSEEDGWNHVYLYNMDGTLAKKLTSGTWEVSRFLGYDEKKQRIFFISTEAGSTERKLYMTSVKTGKKTCLTEETGWHSIQMAPDFSYFVDDYTSLQEPRVVRLYSGEGKKVRDIETNEALKKTLASVQRPEMKLTTFAGADGTPLNAWIMYPPGFDSTKTYPLLMFVYGGPGSQQVANRFPSGQRPLFHEYLVQRGVIMVCVDNRGTGGRGAAFKKQVYKKLGQPEVEDQIAVARYLAAKPWIDEKRVGIWGWSYGGYMAGLCLAMGAEVFTQAVSVAPVSAWEWYDTIYTERYMQTPQQNPEGYKAGSLIEKAPLIKGRYLLMHGTADDNVHVQHAVELAETLTQSDKQFQMMFYRNRNHGIAGGKTREHLHRTMFDFLMQGF